MGRKVERTHAGAEEDWGEGGTKAKKASSEIPWSPGSGHPTLYLAQFGSSVITRRQKHPPPARPVEKYTFQYLCNNLDRISLLHLCK